MRSRLLAAVLVAVLSPSALAQTAPPVATDAGILAAGAPRGSQEASPSGRKDPARATLLSGLGAAAIVVPGVNIAAIPIGPSLGHFYAGNRRQAYTGIAIRSGAFVVGVAALLGEALGGYSGGDDRGGSGETVALGCAAVIVGSAAYDVVTAGAAARAYNRRHGFDTRRAAAVVVAPAVGPDGQRGVRLAVRL